MRLRAASAILLVLTIAGSPVAPATAADAGAAASDAALALSTRDEVPSLRERLVTTLPGASEQAAARTTKETASLAQRAVELRKAAAQRASRAKARAAAARIRLAVPAYGRISASFGSKGRWATRHTGMDINARYGDRVRAVVAGRVMKVTYHPSYGRLVIIRGRGVDIWYAHLASDSVRTGQRVRLGQVIGRVGCSGHCTGAHLHLEVRKNDLPTNPATFLWGSKRGKPGTTPAWARSSIATLDSL